MPNDRALGSLLRQIAWMTAVLPLAGCGDVVVAGMGQVDSGLTDAPPADAPPADAPPVDVTPPRDVPPPPPDTAMCERRLTTDNGCQRVVSYPCGIPGVDAPQVNMYLTSAQCESICRVEGQPSFNAGCRVSAVGPGASASVECITCVVGRRPEGLTPAPAPADGSPVGRYFARTAELEAASVTAFRDLARELAAHGAPGALVAAAERAAHDERLHTRMTRDLARAHGSTPARPSVRRGGLRSLEALARDNAAEGCVRETFGALVAVWQSSHAGDADVAGAMARIADDETRHAELAWSVAAWAHARLDDGARARVATARAEAVGALFDELAREVPAALVSTAGLPARPHALALARAMQASLWS